MSAGKSTRIFSITLSTSAGPLDAMIYPFIEGGSIPEDEFLADAMRDFIAAHDQYAPGDMITISEI